MVRMHRAIATRVVILTFLGTQLNAVVFAAADGAAPQAQQSSPAAPSTAIDVESASGSPTTDAMRFTISDDFFAASAPAPKDLWRSAFAVVPLDAAGSGQRGFRGRGRGRNDGARTAIIVGSVAAIAGTAVLVYANRPDCGNSPRPDGCGYGTKVVGGAVLSAGVVAILVGALTWR
jgi:hypothetical protein